MKPGDKYKNIHTGEVVVLENYVILSGMGLFRNSDEELIRIGSFELKHSWVKQ